MIYENDEMYGLMNWGAMEAIVYSEHDDPHSWLGPHVTEKGILFNTYQPTAKSVRLIVGRDYFDMTNADEQGNFSALVPSDRTEPYRYEVTYDNDEVYEVRDPYMFESQITPEDEDRFIKGIHYEIYEKLGAHYRRINNVWGTYFAVWAPNAERVSVVGDFNGWDGRRHPMRKLRASGIYELFIPGIEEGELYKFELKTNGGLTYLKSDPYATYSELRPNTASIVRNLDYDWKDKEWMKNRKKADVRNMPLNIYEVHLGSWMCKGEGDNDFYS